jgi:hypothetical protein
MAAMVYSTETWGEDSGDSKVRKQQKWIVLGSGLFFKLAASTVQAMVGQLEMDS